MLLPVPNCTSMPVSEAATVLLLTVLPSGLVVVESPSCSKLTCWAVMVRPSAVTLMLVPVTLMLASLAVVLTLNAIVPEKLAASLVKLAVPLPLPLKPALLQSKLPVMSLIASCPPPRFTSPLLTETLTSEPLALKSTLPETLWPDSSLSAPVPSSAKLLPLPLALGTCQLTARLVRDRSAAPLPPKVKLLTLPATEVLVSVRVALPPLTLRMLPSEAFKPVALTLKLLVWPAVAVTVNVPLMPWLEASPMLPV